MVLFRELVFFFTGNRTRKKKKKRKKEEKKKRRKPNEKKKTKKRKEGNRTRKKEKKKKEKRKMAGPNDNGSTRAAASAQRESAELESCAVCFESFNHSSRAPTTCPYCTVKTCRTCLQTYLLHDISDTPCCVNPDCGHGYSREFLDGELTQTFRLRTYKAHREKVLSDRERSRFPSTQADVRAYVDAKARSSALHAEMVALQARCTELTRRHDAAWHASTQRQSDWEQYLAAIRPFRKQMQLLRRELLPLRRIVESFGLVSHSRRDEPAASRREFIKPCPSDA
jgi:hypothetical protein